MAVTKRTRFECFKRDGFKCQYCGRTPPTVVLEADHVIAKSDGGPDDINNLVTSCFDCNRGKSNVPLDSLPQTLAEQARLIQEKREQVEAFDALLAELRAHEDEQILKLGRHWYDKVTGGKGYIFGTSRETSVRAFLKKLPFNEILEAIDLAASRVPGFIRDDGKRFKYFCGVCWNKIKNGGKPR